MGCGSTIKNEVGRWEDDVRENVVDPVADFVGDVGTSVYQQVVYPVYSAVETAAQQAAAEAERVAQAAAAEAKRLEERTAAEFSRFEDRVEKELDRWEEDLSKAFQQVGDAIWDVTMYYPAEWTLSATDFIFEGLGFHSPTKFLKGLNTGLRYIHSGAIRGKKDEMIMAGVIIVSVVLTIMTAGAAGAAFGNIIGGIGYISGGAGIAMTLYATAWVAYNVLIVLSWLYGLYNLIGMAMDISDFGNMLRKGGTKGLAKIVIELDKQQSRMRISAVSNAFNGQMSMWMAGGDLYDSMKAGDISFKVDGNLNSQVFLGLPNTNQGTKFSNYANGNIGNFYSTKHNAMAGDMFFSGTKLVA